MRDAIPTPSSDVVVVSSTAELQDAVASARDGHTILVAPGHYELTQTLRLRGGLSGVTVRGGGTSPDDVVLVGRGMSNADYGNVPHGFLIEDTTSVTIADLSIRDVYFHAVQVQGEKGAANVRMYRLHLVDIGEQFVKVSSGGPPGPYADGGEVACSVIEYTDHARSYYTNGVDVLAGTDWVVRDNVFRRIRGPEGVLAGPTILMWRNTLDSVIERNWIIDSDRGVALGLSAPDPRYARDGNTTFDHQGGVVRNNVFFRQRGMPGDAGITLNYAGDFRVAHNTIVQNGTFPQGAIDYRFPVSSGVIAYNLLDAPIWQRDGASAQLIGNVSSATDDFFMDAAAGDLHLARPITDVTDAAVVLDWVLDDIDGDARPIGTAADVGADEFRFAAPTAPTAISPGTTTPTMPVSSPSPTTGTSSPTATESPDPAETDAALEPSPPEPFGWRAFIPWTGTRG